MKNKIILILILSIAAMTGIYVFADNIQVNIDNTPIEFETPPELNGNTIMVPMKEFFEAMGAKVLWVESERMIIAYKDNMHLKLQLGNKVAFRNGKRFALTTEPYISDGHTLVPLQIIAETFDMKPLWDKDNNVLNLSGSEDEAGLKLFSDGIYKTTPIDDLGITISIPYHWGKLDGPFQYGYDDDFETYSVSLSSQEIKPSLSLDSLVEQNKTLLLNAYGENITFTGEDSMVIDEMLKVKKLYITTKEDGKQQKQVLYILKEGATAYFMTCQYGSEVPEEDIVVVFDNVISTFKIRNLSIDAQEEHYMEFESFYDLGIKLNQEFYSNMVVEESEIPFSGTLNEGHNLEGFYIKVSHGNDYLEFTVPISGNAFDGTIYTPFGLGKHNIFISGIPKDTNGTEPLNTMPQDEVEEPLTDDGLIESKEMGSKQSSELNKDMLSKINDENATSLTPLMQFSVINIDSKTTRYLIPTSVINSLDTQVNSTSMLITYNVSNEYMKARTLFTWVVENIDIDSDASGQTQRTNVQTFDEAIGSPEEINQLYTAYLRAIDIPARVVKGRTSEDSYYWTELYLNGNWVVSDIVEGIRSNDDINDHYTHVTQFNLSLVSFHTGFNSTQIMPY